MRAMRKNSQGAGKPTETTALAIKILCEFFSLLRSLLPSPMFGGLPVNWSPILATKRVPHLQKNLRPQRAGEMGHLALQCVLRNLRLTDILGSRPSLPRLPTLQGVLTGTISHRSNVYVNPCARICFPGNPN